MNRYCIQFTGALSKQSQAGYVHAQLICYCEQFMDDWCLMEQISQGIRNWMATEEGIRAIVRTSGQFTIMDLADEIDSASLRYHLRLKGIEHLTIEVGESDAVLSPDMNLAKIAENPLKKTIA